MKSFFFSPISLLGWFYTLMLDFIYNISFTYPKILPLLWRNTFINKWIKYLPSNDPLPPLPFSYDIVSDDRYGVMNHMDNKGATMIS